MLDIVTRNLTALDITNAALGLAVVGLVGVFVGGAVIEGIRRLGRRDRTAGVTTLRLMNPGATVSGPPVESETARNAC